MNENKQLRVEAVRLALEKPPLNRPRVDGLITEELDVNRLIANAEQIYRFLAQTKGE